MKQLSVLLAVLFAVMALLLLWNESRVTCGTTICKVYETMFIIGALYFAKLSFECEKKKL